jgi:hypothetical protein
MSRKFKVQHRDKIDQDIAAGDSVVTRYFSSLVIGQIVHTTPSKVKVKVHGLKRHKWNRERKDYDISELIIIRRPEEMVVIDSEKVLLYALKNG